MTPVVVAALSVLAMEPAVALIHRRVMHRWAWGWHRSHHRRAGGALEANDLFPAVFAAATVAAMALGATVGALSPLLWVGAGVTAYGGAYLVVHDLFIHERLGRLPGTGSRYIRWVTEAHGVHHRFGTAPYGFLLPVVGRDRRTATRHDGRYPVPSRRTASPADSEWRRSRRLGW